MKKLNRTAWLAPWIAGLWLIGNPLVSWAAPPPTSKTQAPVVVITKPDLIVESIEIAKVGGDSQETILNVTVMVRNKDAGENSGPVPVKHRIKVLLEWIGKDGLRRSWERLIHPLKAGESHQAVFDDCRIRPAQNGTFRATVDPQNQIEEWNEANNGRMVQYEDKP